MWYRSEGREVNLNKTFEFAKIISDLSLDYCNSIPRHFEFIFKWQHLCAQHLHVLDNKFNASEVLCICCEVTRLYYILHTCIISGIGVFAGVTGGGNFFMNSIGFASEFCFWWMESGNLSPCRHDNRLWLHTPVFKLCTRNVILSPAFLIVLTAVSWLEWLMSVPSTADVFV